MTNHTILFLCWQGPFDSEQQAVDNPSLLPLPSSLLSPPSSLLSPLLSLLSSLLSPLSSLLSPLSPSPLSPLSTLCFNSSLPETKSTS